MLMMPSFFMRDLLMLNHRWMRTTSLLLFGIIVLSPSSLKVGNNNHPNWIFRNDNNNVVVTTAAAAATTSLFSSNVVMLTSENWKQVVLDNPQAVFVNICRVG
jgi:hypothetical protein